MGLISAMAAKRKRVLDFISKEENWTKVKSSNIEKVAFFPDDEGAKKEDHLSGYMFVTFKKGTMYGYYGVTYKLFKEAISAESVGKFFQANIKDVYPTVKMS